MCTFFLHTHTHTVGYTIFLSAVLPILSLSMIWYNNCQQCQFLSIYLPLFIFYVLILLFELEATQYTIMCVCVCVCVRALTVLAYLVHICLFDTIWHYLTHWPAYLTHRLVLHCLLCLANTGLFNTFWILFDTLADLSQPGLLVTHCPIWHIHCPIWHILPYSTHSGLFATLAAINIVIPYCYHYMKSVKTTHVIVVSDK